MSIFKEIENRIIKGVKVVTGIQAREDKEKAQRIIEEANAMANEVNRINSMKMDQLNNEVENYQCIQQAVLHNTIGLFREFLKDMKMEKQDNVYKQINNIRIDKIFFQEPNTKLQKPQIIKTVAAGVLFGVFAAGYVASKYRAEQLTEAQRYLCEVKEFKADSERKRVVIDGIILRAEEQGKVLSKLGQRAEYKLEFLRPIALEFIIDEPYHTIVMQKNQALLKPIVEVSQTPIVDKWGGLNNKWGQVKSQTTKLLEKNI